MFFKRSVTSNIAYTLIYIVILSVLSTGLALTTVAHSLKDAEAVNIAGSLRMQSYRLAYGITTHSSHLNDYLDRYEQALNAPALTQLDRFYVPTNLRDKYHHLLIRWHTFAGEIRSGNYPLYLDQVANYVEQIDDFVFAVQHFSEQKLWAAGIISLVSFIATFILVFFAIRFTRRKIVDPLNQMVAASSRIQSGNFDLPPLNSSLENELGVLSQSFNSMAIELGKLYRSLAEQVEEKTGELTQANRTLNVLYECSQALSLTLLDDACFKKVLNIVRQSEKMIAIKLVVHGSGDSHWLLTSGQIDNSLVWQHLNLNQEDRRLGVLSWQCADGHQPHPHFIQNVINMLNRGITFQQAQKQSLHLLLMEERATIARELHDSLAQSLSFLRIQLTLLKRLLPNDDSQANDLITDIDNALTNAYQQLRELLATFRLTIQEADLHEALHQLIAPLQAQSRVKIHLHCAIPSQTLNAQQQVHALQIVREAVMNAIKHANAENIYINCHSTVNSNNIFNVTDDGCGIPSSEEPDGHYGLNIMSERAASLNGHLKIEPLSGRGTAVTLTFPR